MEQSIIGNRSRSILRFGSAIDMDRPKRNTILFSSLLKDRNILCIKRTLARVIQNIAFLFYMRMLGAFFEPWRIRFLIKR